MKNYDLLNRMTVREKLLLLTGGSAFTTRSFLKYGIVPVSFSDGPNGLRRKGTHICYPCSAAMASSWNKDLIKDEAESFASECANSRVSLLLAPGINIKRHPYCGRNFEYYSEDPYLTAEMASTFISSLQNKGIGACLKHYFANNCETKRMTSNSVIDKRAIREIYTYAFEKTIEKSDPWAIMTCYNRVNGEYPAESKEFLINLLRKTFGYKNLVMTDWNATSDRVAQLQATNDLEMPSSGYYSVNNLIKAFHEGKITEKQINNSCKRFIKMIDKSEEKLRTPIENIDLDDLHKKTVNYALETAVLLKNDNNVFPIKRADKVAIIGDYAENPMISGEGSARVKPYKSENLISLFRKNGYNIDFSKGYELSDIKSKNKYLLNEAIAVARKADKIIIFAGSLKSEYAESVDRFTIDLPENQLKLIDEMIKLKKEVAVVTCSSSVVKLPFDDKVQTIMHTYPMGEGGQEALFRLISGKVSPSGKLAETFIKSEEDIPSKNIFGDRFENVVYDESIFVGYRYYDKAKKEVAYPFGHGLSYAKFEYSDLNIDNKLNLTFKIKNTSDIKASEITQVYISFADESMVCRPEKVLKAFTKTEVEPHETKTVKIKLSRDSFEYFSTKLNKFVIEKGRYKILVASSSKDIRLQKTLVMNVKEEKEVNHKKLLPSYYMGRPDLASDEEVQVLFDNKLSDYKVKDSSDYDPFTTLSDTYKFSAIKRQIENITDKIAPERNVYVQMGMDSAGNFPVSRIAEISRGALNKDAAKSFYKIFSENNKLKNYKSLAVNTIKSLTTAIMSLYYKDKK